MQEQISLKTELFGHELRVNAARLDEGIQVTIAGGSHSHIGSVSFVGYNGTIETIQLPGHKDAHISTHWPKSYGIISKSQSVFNAVFILTI